jgi:preprotein translocase subunit SecG
MSLFIFLMVVQALIGACMVGVILIQKSEGGGLGMGGSPTGFMSARGAADFLTRATSILAALFVVLSIVLAALAVKTSSGDSVDTSLNRTVPVPSSAPADPLAAGAQQTAPQQAAPQQAPAHSTLPLDPLAPATKK